MKKIFILFAIFLILICISSFSWASVDVSSAYLNFDLFESNIVSGQVGVSALTTYYSQAEIDQLQYVFVLKFPAEFGNLIQIYFSDTKPYIDNGYVFMFPTILPINAHDFPVFDISNGELRYYGTSNHVEINLSDLSVITLFSNTPIYIDNTYENEDSMTGYNFYYDTSFYSAFANQGGGESGGGEEEEENDGLLAFITNFFDNLLHLVVPDAEDWQEIQDSFQDDILGRFDIDTWSFNDNLNVIYSEELGIYEPRYSAPYFDFGAFGVLRLDGINDLLNTPISLGKMDTHYDEAIGPIVELETNGVTIRDLINYLLAIEIFILNIFLYNKFFAKGE